MSGTEYRDYENGVADVLASIVGEGARVERNVSLPSESGVGNRQIDVMVEGRIFGIADAKLVVDCKRWKDSLDIADVGQFGDLVSDVGADFGMIVCATGASEAAQARARKLRGIRVRVLSTDELAMWRPAGTVHTRIVLAEHDIPDATRRLRNAGFRVREFNAPENNGLEIFRYYGSGNPSGEQQQGHNNLIDTTLHEAGINYTHHSGGISISGGTPSHRWLQFGINGNPVAKMIAANDADIESNISRLAEIVGVDREIITVDRPDIWPIKSPFDD